ncbi:kinase-like protein [Amniculicola lignicola CBS 123094]|uniref:Kinase-like protein n=1 Tax=Amniculicola lignicola CBS 123094 TaxID=1392246 RepID=A0A6A5WD32_9PLEO|nr:kinase-like protein [Amniculicola lignicola CBS 123094]
MPLRLSKDSLKDFHYVVKEELILPFIEETFIGGGAFGRVYKVAVLAECQTLLESHKMVMVESQPAKRSLNVVHIARKELARGPGAASEGSILRLLTQLEHPNIVEFLGSYTYSTLWNLLFPFHPLNMEEFLRRPLELRKNIVYQSIYGLADAIRAIHDFTMKDGNNLITGIGYHHDLSPANILVDGDRFVITDFGLSRLKLDGQDSKTKLKGGHEDYLGPEAYDYDQGRNLTVGRSLDIWAFGCISSEIAALTAGLSVKDFHDGRKGTHEGKLAVTDHAFHMDGETHPLVKSVLEQIVLQSADEPSKAFVRSALEMLHPDPQERIAAGDVADRLALVAVQSAYLFAVQSLDPKPLLAKGDIDNAAFYLLERTRLESWWTTYYQLSEPRVYKQVHDLLSLLNTIGNSLNEDRIRTDAVGAPGGILRNLWQAIDAIHSHLPIEARQIAATQWSSTVCECEDTAILGAIRRARRFDRYGDVGANATMKYFLESLSSSLANGENRRLVSREYVEYEKVSFPTKVTGNGISVPGNPSRTIGTYQLSGASHAVLIEWKQYNPPLDDASSRDELHNRMDALVNLLDPEETPRPALPHANRVLECVGYFHERNNHKFGFLFPLTTERPESCRIYSVHQYIAITDLDLEDDHIKRPDLGHQFQLATGLAFCLWSFHIAGWVHKNISSHQVICLAQSVADIHFTFGASALAGFIHSRPEASEVTLGPIDEESECYKHPRYLPNVRFRRAFDYYSLGIVLLELGTWSTMESLRSYHSETNIEDFKETLLSTYVPLLRERRGSIYESVVRSCLEFEKLCPNTDKDTELHFFKRNVLDALAQCNA